MIRRTFALNILLVSVTLALAACGGSLSGDSAAQEPETQTVIDSLDREVTMPAQVERIVSLAPSVTESLYAIGAGDLLIGRSSFDDFPPEVLDVAEVGGFSANDISVETIVALEPDVVIAGSTLQEPLIDAFEAVGIPYFLSTPDGLDEVYEALAVFGQLTDHEDEAQAVVDDMQERVAAVDAIVSAIPDGERLTVFYEVWDEPLLTAGPGTFIGQMIVIAGGVDIFADVKVPWSEVSTESVIERQPQVILGPATHADGLSLEVLNARPGWDSIPAVQNGAVYLLEDNVISRSGPRVVDAIELIAASLYPDLF